MRVSGWLPLTVARQNFMEKEIKEAYEEIEKLIETAHAAIKEAKKVAKKYGLIFSVDFGYGICGVFDESASNDKNTNKNEWEHSECISKLDDEWEPSGEYNEEWEPSSEIEDDWPPF